jgi:hypothetical protein
MNDAPLDAEEGQVLFACNNALDDARRLTRRLQGEGRVPEQVHLMTLQELVQIAALMARTVRAKNRHRFSAACATFHPE